MNPVTNCDKCGGTGKCYTAYLHPTHAGGPFERIVESYCDCPAGAHQRARETSTAVFNRVEPMECETRITPSSKSEAKRKRRDERRRLQWSHR